MVNRSPASVRRRIALTALRSWRCAITVMLHRLRCPRAGGSGVGPVDETRTLRGAGGYAAAGAGALFTEESGAGMSAEATTTMMNATA